jgi:hypothetical protein
MASLKIKEGSPVKVDNGVVELMGSCVALYENGKDGEEMESLVVAYCLLPGEKVTRVKRGEYIVEF